jgi:hypothetical protein
VMKRAGLNPNPGAAPPVPVGAPGKG